MRIVDTLAYFGVDSGTRTLVVTKAETAVLLRAVAILERAHEIVTAFDPDHQERNGLRDALCMAPEAIHDLATTGLEVA